MELKRIDHVGIVVASLERHVAQLEALGLTLARRLEAVGRLLEVRGIEVTWPPFPSGTAEMIWTKAETSGCVQYQFLVRPAPEN